MTFGHGTLNTDDLQEEIVKGAWPCGLQRCDVRQERIRERIAGAIVDVLVSDLGRNADHLSGARAEMHGRVDRGRVLSQITEDIVK